LGDMSLILSSTTESPEEAGIPSTDSIAPRPLPRARLGAGAAFLGAALETGFFAAGFAVFVALAGDFAAVLDLAGLPAGFLAAGAAFFPVFLILAICNSPYNI
jgi:hypothetical protein